MVTKANPDQSSLPETTRQAKRLGICVYCGAPAQEIDHIIPRALHGPNDRGNKLPICKKCNRMKLDQPPIQFIRRLMKENGLPFKYRSLTPEQLEETVLPRLLITEFVQGGFANEGFRLALYLENERVVFEVTHKSRPKEPVLHGDLFALIVLGFGVEDFKLDKPDMTEMLSRFLKPYIPKLGALKLFYDPVPAFPNYGIRRIQRIFTWAIEQVNWHDLHTGLK